jgi:predicted permease
MSRRRRLFGFVTRSRRDIDADVDDEIAFHLDMRVRELVERGWTADAARREAHRQFGDLRTTADYCRRLDADKESEMRFRLSLHELRQDITYGARLLLGQPGASLVALLSIALGVGATTLVFSVVHASLLAPLPYRDADRLVVARVSLPDYADLQASVDVFEDAGVYASNLYTLDDEQILGGVVTTGLFTTLGVAPQIGRAIEPADGPSPVVVLGHRLWQRRFGADPQIVGRTVQLSGTAFTVVGVMPARFQFPTRAFELWTGMDYSMTLVPQQAKNRALRIFQVVGRLRPSLTTVQAQAQITALSERLAAAHPATNTGVSMTLVSVRDRLVGNVRTALLVALGAVACLLFIACANVASLSLARLTTRTQELAVRAALGAGRWRIARQLATESLLTAACGGTIGILGAWWGLTALPALVAGRVPRIDDITLSVPVLAVSLAAIVIGGLLVAAVPVLHLSMTRIDPALKEGGRGGSDRPAGIRLRSALVVVQIGVAVIVLAGALVLTRSLVRLLSVDAGFAPDRLLTFNLPLIGQPESLRSTVTARVLESIAAVPGVEAVGGATGLAPVTAQRGTTFDVEARPDAPLDERRAYFIAASPGYFAALGARLTAGREFTARDAAGAPLVVIISKTIADRFFPNGDAVGRRLRLVNPEQSHEWRTIVGVAGNVRYQGLDDANPAAVYTPFTQTPFPWMYVHVRTEGDPLALIGIVRGVVKTVDQRLTMANPQAMTSLVSDSSADPRFRTILISLFAAIAVVLSAIGLHGVVAFGVARRSKEIAIRLALGAPVGSLRWRVIRDAVRLALGGIVIGLLGAMAIGGTIAGLLYDTEPSDPLALGLVAALLLAVAIVASVVPAQRATRIQPVTALRDS